MRGHRHDGPSRRPGLGNRPDLVIAGADDPATPPSFAEDIAARMPHARVEVISDAAHLANVEQPEAVTEALLEHLDASGSS